jgi:hypothetical protein
MPQLERAIQIKNDFMVWNYRVLKVVLEKDLLCHGQNMVYYKFMSYGHPTTSDSS